VKLRTPYRRHAWIPAVVPADARCFRVHDAELAGLLCEAGAEVVDTKPEVEIGPVDGLRGDGPCTVVPLEAPRREVESRLVRAGGRVRESFRIRREARRAEAALQQLGYGSTAVATWELEQHVRAPWLPTGRPRARGAERFPLGAVVVGHRSSRLPTALEAALACVSADDGHDTLAALPTVRAGMLVAFSAEGVLRVAIGPGRTEMERQRETLALLRRCRPTAAVSDRVPWPLDSGRIGLADWSLERTLPGKAVAHEGGQRFSADCLDFLAELFRATDDESGEDVLARDADLVASAADVADRAPIESLARALEAEIAGVPVGFGHGDFWGGNLLAQNGRLVGVVDWDAAGPGRLPLLDLFHFRLSAAASRARRPLGHVIADEFEQSGMDELTREYCERIDLEPDDHLRRALLAVYWLDYIAYQVRFFIDPSDRPKWVRDNVAVVVGVLRSRRASVLPAA
jgi:aminoglycoside phosphotransferase (APT) family kinase protein